MTAWSFGTEVSDALDPILTPVGFAPGQYGGRQIIFCCASDAFHERFPELPQATTQPPGPGLCFDLVIDGDDHDRLTRIDLEGLSLERTLRLLGHGDDADATSAALGRPIGDALGVLIPVLRALVSGR